MKNNFLFVNPWIHDFAAYNLWTRPHGFLTLASCFKHNSLDVTYIDLLHVSDSDAAEFGISIPGKKPFSQGKFFQQPIEKPAAYGPVNRVYRRFGLPPDCFRTKLSRISRPEAVFVSSGMTYWYRGVQETISVIREFWKDVPVLLGGVYATLCEKHAVETSGADVVFPGSWEDNIDKIRKHLGSSFPVISVPKNLPAANYLYPNTGFAVMRFTAGCPFHCSYCASSFISGQFRKRNPEHIIQEIYSNIDEGRIDIALYDDALLVDSENHLLPVLSEIKSSGKTCRFHTPNGLHSRYVDHTVAEALYQSGFKTVRLSFESLSGPAHDASDGKVVPSDLESALDSLFSAGYRKGDIDVYILIGIPGQDDNSVFESADFVHGLGGNIKTAQYSPIPHTSFFQCNRDLIPGLEEEPLLQNSTIAPCWGFDLNRYDTVKRYVRDLNNNLRQNT